MLVVLLLAGGVVADWVEIAQHPHRAAPRRTTYIADVTTETNRLYANSSLTEHTWHRNGPPRTPNFGVVKRVKLQGREKNVLFESAHTETKSGEFERYESVGPVRAPSRKNEQTVDNYKEKKTNDVGNFRKLNVSNIRLHSPSRRVDVGNENTFTEFSTDTGTIINDRDNTALNYNKRIQVIPNTKYVLTGSGDGFRKEMQVDKESHLNVKRPLKVNENRVKYKVEVTTGNIPTIHSTTSKTLFEHQRSPSENIGHAPKSVHNNDRAAYRHFDLKNDTDRHRIKQGAIENSDNYANPNLTERQDLNLDGNTKTNTIEIIWKLMKVVTDSISQNTRRSFRSKIRYLEDLRNNIILNIAERVDRTWPDDAETGPGAAAKDSRRRRAARGHVEFPSSESALMTISFLTFAVFLIKLVLQVIHTYKNKTMMVTPAVVAAVGRAVRAPSHKLGKQNHS